MKQLILMRHGKSSWDYDVSDKDRPLQERGINDAHKVSKTFGLHAPKIDFIFSSPANRALHTSMIFVRNLEYDLSNFRVNHMLYDFSGNSVEQYSNWTMPWIPWRSLATIMPLPRLQILGEISILTTFPRQDWSILHLVWTIGPK